jgi:hypothetical protein
MGKLNVQSAVRIRHLSGIGTAKKQTVFGEIRIHSVLLLVTAARLCTVAQETADPTSLFSDS